MSIEYFFDCMIKWWGQLSYTTWMYFGLLLPVTALIYQIVPRKARKTVLLIASWFFFYSLSGLLLIANIAASVFVWGMGRFLDQISNDKSLKKKQRKKKLLKKLKKKLQLKKQKKKLLLKNLRKMK